MHTNDTNKNQKLIYPNCLILSRGVCFEVHNELGRYAREKQYGDLLEKRLKEMKIPYEREFRIKETGNIVDFLVDNKIILEVKTRPLMVKEDYYQVQRYL